MNDITTRITTIQAFVSPEWYGDYADDFDVEAINADYRDALEAAAREFAPSVTIHTNGDVIVAVGDVTAAWLIDWDELAEEIDVAAIAERHERPRPEEGRGA